MIKTAEQKFRTVIEKNTFYFFNRKFEEKYEGYLNSVRETLLILKNEIEIKGLKKEIFERLLAENENGLTAMLALTGFSNESFKRLITLIRVVDNPQLAKLSLRDNWNRFKGSENIREWSDDKIAGMVQKNEYFRAGIVNLFFEGATIPLLTKTIPLFELKKMSISKLQFDVSAMIDTLVRYKEKGSYSGKKENNPETIIAELLENSDITFENGDLRELIANAPDKKRTMDFIIPNKQHPRIIAECSFLVTTSSGQGDKSKTEISIRQLIKKHYPRQSSSDLLTGSAGTSAKKTLKEWYPLMMMSSHFIKMN